ncbi:hypothetical protein G9A89_008923 [Geosiphon pyriformis]|nr:hypothetical protein G9A89_008923 [Geosiphon pyriformis]
MASKPRAHNKFRNSLRKMNLKNQNSKCMSHKSKFISKVKTEKLRGILNLFPVPYRLDQFLDTKDPNVFKKPNGEIKRPPNSFLVFRQVAMKRMKEVFSPEDHSFFENTDQPEYSKMFGEIWKSSNETEQSSYKDLCEQVNRTHKKLHPHWKYCPKRGKATFKFVPYEKFESSQNEIDIYNIECDDCPEICDNDLLFNDEIQITLTEPMSQNIEPEYQGTLDTFMNNEIDVFMNNEFEIEHMRFLQAPEYISQMGSPSSESDFESDNQSYFEMDPYLISLDVDCTFSFENISYDTILNNVYPDMKC